MGSNAESVPSFADPDAAAEEDWFGDGTPFGSGEDLAAALFTIAGSSDSAVEGVLTPRPAAHHEVTSYDLRAGFDASEDGDRLRPETSAPVPLPLPVPRPLAGFASTATETPSRALAERTDWVTLQPRGGVGRRGWGMRSGVHGLKLAEAAIRQLQRDAIEVTWRAAAVAIAQQRGESTEERV